MSWSGGELSARDGTRFARFDLTVDVPVAAATRAQRRLTDTVVRVAEMLRRPDDVYHQVSREPAAAEPTLLPVGPAVQQLGERLHLSLSRQAGEGRTQLWLALARSQALVQVVDAERYDPEAKGEPDRLLAESDCVPRWAAASAFVLRPPVMILRLRLFVPEDRTRQVARQLERLEEHMARPD